MNIEKIYKAVDNDEMNSPLLTIISELMLQGYEVILEGVELTKEDLNESLVEDLEKSTNEYIIELVKNRETEQKFKLVFNEYHSFNFKKA